MQRKIRILIVDDDQDLMRLFRLALANKGFDIASAFDSDTALTLARELRPDLILLDIMLPGEVDGIEVCRRLRGDPAMQGSGIVMVSARTDAKARQEAIKAGAADYWAKPVSARDLADKVRAVLNIKGEFPARPTATQPRPAPVGAWSTPAHDPLMDSIVKLLHELEPADRQEIKALIEARLALKRGKAT